MSTYHPISPEGYDRLKRSLAADDPGVSPTLPLQFPDDQQSTAPEQYLILRQVARGGMGIVYEAEDSRLNRRVALKFLKGEDPEEVARFRREAQIAGSLSHPNIAAIYETGESRGEPFIAMQYVEGRTLEKFPRDNPGLLARLIRDAARALSYAHGRDVVHRDLKPANLMVETREKTGSGPSSSFHLYVMDFGLARPIKAGSSVSLSGVVVGTPVYMAPEQARGERVDGRADIYSLGATLYELLAGQPPFKGANVYEILRNVNDKEAPPLRGVNPTISHDLATIVEKCMEKDPARRYATAGDLADDLDRYLQGEPVQARPQSLLYRTRKRLYKRRAAVAAVLATVAAVSTAAYFIPRWQQARSDLESLKELGAMWTQVVLAKQGFHNASEDPRRVRARIEEALRGVEEYVVRHPDQPQGHYVRARGLLYLDDIHEAERELRESLRLEAEFIPGQALLARTLLERYMNELLVPKSNEGRERMFLDARPLLLEAETLLARGWNAGSERESIRRWGLAKTPEDDVGETLIRAIAAMYIHDQAQEAIRILVEADERTPAAEFSNLLGTWHPGPEEKIRYQTQAIGRMPHFATAYFARAGAREFQKDYQGMVADLSAAIRINPAFAMAYNNRGVGRRLLGDFDGAIEDSSKAIELDPGHPSAYSNRAETFLKKGDVERAIADCDTIVRIRPGSAASHVFRAECLRVLGRLDEAVADLDRAIRIDAGHFDAHVDRAVCHGMAGALDKALADAGKAVELKPGSPQGYINRAIILGKKNEIDAAIADCERAVKVDPRNAGACVTWGNLLEKKGDTAGAIAAFDRAIEYDPMMPEAYANRATSRHKEGDGPGAIADCLKALDLAPQRWIHRRKVENFLSHLRASDH